MSIISNLFHMLAACVAFYFGMDAILNLSFYYGIALLVCGGVFVFTAPRVI